MRSGSAGSGHLDQILPHHQREEAPGGGGSQGIGERQVLQHQGIAGTQGRTAETRREDWPREAVGVRRSGGELHPFR